MAKTALECGSEVETAVVRVMLELRRGRLARHGGVGALFLGAAHEAPGKHRPEAHKPHGEPDRAGQRAGEGVAGPEQGVEDRPGPGQRDRPGEHPHHREDAGGDPDLSPGIAAIAAVDIGA